jgi:predicted nucleic acid-binding Zn ribbon protein
LTRPRKHSASQPQLVGELVGKYLSRTGLTGKLEAASVLPQWPELVGPQIAAVTEPQRVSDGVLIVAVRSSAWMMELNMMKSELMRRINAGRGEGRVRQLIFVMQG